MRDFLQALHAGTAQRWEWFKEKAQTRQAQMWLGTYSFLETVLIPFPTDPFLAIMVYVDRARAVWLTVWTILTSALGAVVGYLLAYGAYDVLVYPIAVQTGLADDIAQVSSSLGEFTFIATFIGAFTPIPFTPVIFAAGFLKVNFFSFFLAVVIGRTLRYALVSTITHFFGVAVLPRLGRFAVEVTAGVVIIVLIAAGVFIVF